MAITVLEELNTILADRKIPAKLSDDGEQLAILFDEELAGAQVFGQLYRIPYPDADKGGYWHLLWEVADITGIPEESRVHLGVAVAMLNPSLPMGGYGMHGYTVQTETEDQSKTLVYRVSIPLPADFDEHWVTQELVEALTVSASVLKATAPTMLCVAEGRMTASEFMKEMLA